MALPNPGNFVTPATDSIFQTIVNKLMADFGDPHTVIIHQKPLVQMCPNEGYDSVNKRGNGIYNASNPNPLGPLNKPFARGQICGVCGGDGKLNSVQNTEITCFVLKKNQEAKELEEKLAIVPGSIIKLIAQAEHHSMLNSNKQATIDGLMYERYGDLKVFGLLTQAYVSGFWKRI